MSGYSVPFAKQDLLHHTLQIGGTAVCELHRPEQTIHATFEAELTDQTVVINAEIGNSTGQLTLQRKDRANHLHLRDFLQDIANGRLESPLSLEMELTEVHLCVESVVTDDHLVYVSPTNSAEYPYGAVVTDQGGNLCASAMGKSKESLAELIRLKLLPAPEGHGEAVA